MYWTEPSRKLSLGPWGVMTEDAAGLLMERELQGRKGVVDYVMKLARWARNPAVLIVFIFY